MLIAIDHGNKLVKIPNHAPFTSGLQQSETPPYGGETLKYKGKYYTLSEKRIPYHRDKTEDERFFILSLFAIAYEIQAAGAYTPNLMRVQLAVGLPPAHYGAQHKAFTRYFSERGVVQFKFQNQAYSIYIDQVLCFPQAYAAAVTILQSLMDKPKAIIIDQGGMTTDLMLLKDGAGDLSVCESLEHGVITLYNQVKSKVNAELDILIGPHEIRGMARLPCPVLHFSVATAIKLSIISSRWQYCSGDRQDIFCVRIEWSVSDIFPSRR